MHYEKVDLNNNMDRWVGKVAVVTGASSGIGAATAVGLVKAGLKVVGLARRVERVEELKKQIPRNATGLLFARKCDVSSEQEIKDTFAWIIEKFGGVDILVNNAGVLNQTSLSGAGDSALIRQTLDINILGLVFCTREAYQSMKSRGVAGHIIHINSFAGHGVPFLLGSPSLNIYPPSKYAVTAIAEVHRQEFLADASKVKVTSISPGLVFTEIVPKEFSNRPGLNAEDISDAVLYVLGTPAHVQISELTVKPVGETF